MVVIDLSFWRGKRVLITGHTGFKGSWLAFWLHKLGAHVVGLSLIPTTNPNLFELLDLNSDLESHIGDVRDLDKVCALINRCKPNIIFHLAAQTLVRKSYCDPIETFSSNLMGTVHTLEAIRLSDSVKSAVFVTTDKVYENLEHYYPYREDDKLGGYDPYSASKTTCEIAISSYHRSFLKEKNVAIASARAGNVIGGGDWSEDRLLPDAVRAWSVGKTLEIRNPNAVRPWQHVLDSLFGYLRLAERLWMDPKTAGSYNFGPYTQEAANVCDVVMRAQAFYGKGQIELCDAQTGPHEAQWLSLEVSKARHVLNVAPRWTLEDAIARTMKWYRLYGEGQNVRDLCLADIEAFSQVQSAAKS